MRISDWSSDVCSSDLSGVCQDLAHVFIAAARSQGMAARYISGHLLRQDGAELQEAAHAWAEAHVPGLGWVAFDPANGRSEEHTSELQSLMRISYAVFCLNKKK